MKILIKLSQFILILILVTSCKTIIKKEPIIIESEKEKSDSIVEEKNKMEIRVSCGKGDVSKFLKEGVVIIEEFSEEKVCSWKSYPANKNCDMEKDKGC